MGDTTAIEWTDRTFNPWWGCSRVSPACRFCYADRDASRWGHELWRRNGPRKPMSEAYWRKPATWNREAERAGRPTKVFCASMADVFEDHPQVGPWRERLFGVIESTPWLIWQLLTKRIENVAGMVPWSGTWPSNVWIGTSVETQRFANQRVLVLLALTGAAVRFLSCEPLLGPVDLSRWLWLTGSSTAGPWTDWTGRRRYMDGKGRMLPSGIGGQTVSHLPASDLSWVISGGESGPKARPSHPDWFRSLRDQCTEAGVPFLHKQHGEWRETGQYDWFPDRRCQVIDPNGKLLGRPWREVQKLGTAEHEGCAVVSRVGKKAAGRELDGREWSEYPA